MAVLLAFAAGYTYDFLAEELPLLPDRSPSHSRTDVAERTNQPNQITAIDLYNAYEANEVIFRRDYIGKTLHVTGIVSHVTSEPSETIVHLKTRKPSPSNETFGDMDFSNIGFPKISCYFTGDKVFEPANMQSGDLVTLQGTVELERDLGEGWVQHHVAPVLQECRALEPLP